jgi:glycogen(starch) synthase
MRVGLVSYEYPPQQGMGGVGTYMFRLAGALGKAGHEVHVITGPSDRAPVQQENVTLHRIAAEFEPEASRLTRWAYWHAIAVPVGRCNPVIWHWLRWNLASYEAIKEIDAQHPFDVVEAPEHAANGWMAGRIHSWPIVIRMHCPWELFVRINRVPFNLMDRVMSMLERRTVANYADGITVPSEAMRREVAKSWKLRQPPRVIPNFMDVPQTPAEMPSDDGPQRIVCAGRIEPLKGQDTLARAFAIVAKRNPRAELWLLGPDRWGKQSFAELLKKIVPDAAVRARIFMPGLVPLSEIGEHLRQARVVVVASIGFESFSYSTLEAMASARPTVVSATGALPELIEHEKSGLVVTPGEPHELAAALERYLADRRLSESCRMAGFARAREKYDTGVVLPQMIESYEAAAEVYYGEGRLKAKARRASTGKSTRPCHLEDVRPLKRETVELAAVG